MRRLLVAVTGALAALLLAPAALAGREVTGPIVALSTDAITVHGKSGNLTCGIATASPKPRGVHVGDTVLAACVTGDDRDAGEPAWILGAISGKDGRPGPGRYTFTRNGVDVAEGVVVGGDSTNRGRTTTSMTLRPVNGGALVHCAWASMIPPPRSSIIRVGCRNGVAVGVDRDTSLLSDTVVLSGTVVSARPVLRVTPRNGGVAACGYGDLSPDPSDFAVGATVAFICDRGTVGELRFLHTRDLVWAWSSEASMSADERTVSISDQSFETVTCVIHALSPERVLAGIFTCDHGVYTELPHEWSYPDGCVTAVSDGSLTLHTVQGATVTLARSWRLGFMLDMQQLPAGTRATDILHVGDFVHTQTGVLGPALADVVLMGVQKKSKGCDYPARFCVNAP